MAASRRFVWVEVNRDVTPEVPKRFSVSAYPTVLTVEPEGLKKIHRFSAYKERDELLVLLWEALERWDLFRSGQPWDIPRPRPATITDRGALHSDPAPTEEIPNGMVLVGNDPLYVNLGGTVHALDTEHGWSERTFAVGPRVIDLATDGKELYAVETGWTAGAPIHVIDPETGETIREIVTEENKKNRAHGAKGIAWRDGTLHVLEGMSGRIRAVDPETGEVTATLQTEGRWLAGLAFDGRNFVAGGREEVVYLDPDSGKVVRRIPVNYPVRAVAALGPDRLGLMEQPVFGYDTDHHRIRVWPERIRLHVVDPDEATAKPR